MPFDADTIVHTLLCSALCDSCLSKVYRAIVPVHGSRKDTLKEYFPGEAGERESTARNQKETRKSRQNRPPSAGEAALRASSLLFKQRGLPCSQRMVATCFFAVESWMTSRSAMS